MANSLTYTFGDADIKGSLYGTVFVPDVHDEEYQEQWQDMVQSAVSDLGMYPVFQNVTWVITSITKDIFGHGRGDSPSHAYGVAIDLGICFSDKDIIPPSGSFPNFATNLVRLLPLSKIKIPTLFVVEGDHIHITKCPISVQRGSLITAPTISSYYNIHKDIMEDPMYKEIFGEFFFFTSNPLELKRAPGLKNHLMRILNEYLMNQNHGF